VEHEEALQARAVVGQLADAVEHQVHQLLADGVVAARVVVGRVLLARDDLLGVVQLAVRARAHLIAHRRLQVHVHRARHVLARARLREEGVERVVATADRLVRRHLPVRLDPVLQAAMPCNQPSAHRGQHRLAHRMWRGPDSPVELPARIAGLDAALAHVDGDGLTHGRSRRGLRVMRWTEARGRSGPGARQGEIAAGPLVWVSLLRTRGKPPGQTAISNPGPGPPQVYSTTPPPNTSEGVSGRASDVSLLASFTLSCKPPGPHAISNSGVPDLSWGAFRRLFCVGDFNDSVEGTAANGDLDVRSTTLLMLAKSQAGPMGLKRRL
jgi:hypothetical protein